MIRKQLMRNGIGTSKSDAVTRFRMRGTEVSRLEGFSDAVFAFAITLLIVSLQPPESFSRLMQDVQGFLPFAVCFVLLAVVWMQHYVFFRRYGLQDPLTVALNLALLFVVLFYVYPLKYLFSLAFGQVHEVPALSDIQGQQLFTIYGAGYAATFVIFALLYLNAYRNRAELGLNALELFDTRTGMIASLLMAGVGLLSIVIAWLTHGNWINASGFVYVVIAPVQFIYRRIRGRQRRAIEQRVSAEQPAVATAANA